MIHLGDCLEVMAGMEPESVDAIVTDPPYGLGFMGKAWDHGAPGIPFWREMLRVAKPSAYLLAFGGTRTVHRIATNIEDAGWIIRDMLVWAYASGFPKSKASLKPAWEPIVMARKPGPLRMLAIDECRIPGQWSTWRKSDGSINHEQESATSYAWDGERQEHPSGRWPANVILTDEIFDGGIEGVVGGGDQRSPETYVRSIRADGGVTRWNTEADGAEVPGYGDSGTYSRFFVLPKSDRADREPILDEYAYRLHRERGECEADADRATFGSLSRRSVCGRCGKPLPRVGSHPTVKPVDLMRHLVRLVTPAGGTVLDPFLGSGSTGLAAELEGFAWIGIEKEAEYVVIAEARLNGTQRGFGLG